MNELRSMLGTRDGGPSMKVTPEGQHNHELCAASERFLKTSINKGHTLLVNESLLMKYRGRMVALCLQTFTASDGSVFEEGVWYSPLNKRSFFKNQYKKGMTKLSMPKGVNWGKVRKIKESGMNEDPDLIALARGYAANVSGKS